MRLLLLLVFLLLIRTAFAQEADTIWYNSKWEKTDKADRFYYRVLKWDDAKQHYFVQDHYPSGRIQMQGSYASLSPEIKNGEFIWWYKNGNKRKEATFKDDVMVKSKDWDVDGKLKSQGELIQTVTYKDGESVQELTFIELAPVFPGGEKALSDFIAKNLRYPSDALKKGIGGIVTVRFVVNEKGKVVNPQIIEGVHPSLDKEALRLVKAMPKWKPGKQGGKTVSIKVDMPFRFIN